MGKLIFTGLVVALLLVAASLLTNRSEPGGPSLGKSELPLDFASAPASPITNDQPADSGQGLPSSRFQNKAPAFQLQDYEGRTVAMADFQGQPVVINSWAAWCPFCKEELKDFAQVQAEFKDSVVIIAIDRAEPLSVAKKFSDELGVTDKLVMLLDPTDSFYRSIGGFSMPETIFVDARGLIVDHKRGPMDAAEIKQRLEKLL